MAGYLHITMFVIFGLFILTFYHAESKYCYSQVRGRYHYCSSRSSCCSSDSDPCCYDTSLTTAAIVGIVIALLFVIVFIAIVVYLIYRANQRKRTGVTTMTTTVPVQTIHTTTYNQGAYPNQGYPPPGQTYPPPPMYGTNQQGTNPAYPPPPTY